MKSFIILILLVIILSSIISFVDVGSQRATVVEFSIPFMLDDDARLKAAKLFALGFFSSADVNYEDEHLAMASGRVFFLGKKAKGLNINIQSAIRTIDDKTTISIGIPALPPESR